MFNPNQKNKDALSIVFSFLTIHDLNKTARVGKFWNKKTMEIFDTKTKIIADIYKNIQNVKESKGTLSKLCLNDRTLALYSVAFDVKQTPSLMNGNEIVILCDKHKDVAKFVIVFKEIHPRLDSNHLATILTKYPDLITLFLKENDLKEKIMSDVNNVVKICKLSKDFTKDVISDKKIGPKLKGTHLIAISTSHPDLFMSIIQQDNFLKKMRPEMNHNFLISMLKVSINEEKELAEKSKKIVEALTFILADDELSRKFVFNVFVLNPEIFGNTNFLQVQDRDLLAGMILTTHNSKITLDQDVVFKLGNTTAENAQTVINDPNLTKMISDAQQIELLSLIDASSRDNMQL